MNRILNRLAVLTATGATVLAVVRWPRMATWGATPVEAEGPIAGDELVPGAKYRTTHAVTVHSAVEAVWPWLVQMGQGRGGLYSYDWLENVFGLHMHSADRVVPELQHLEVGDVVRMVPEGTQPDLSFSVLRVEPPRLLVLGTTESRETVLASGMPYPAWTFELRPLDKDTTRLVVRFQSDFAPTVVGWLLNKYALEPVHCAMERKMLLGIKERAERAA